jgi:hypothetical protein
MATLIRLADQDNVAVATTNLAKGATVEVDGLTLTTRDPIPFAHKMAIAAGQHVHVHNIRSDYVNNEVDFFEEAAVGEPAKGAAS